MHDVAAEIVRRVTDQYGIALPDGPRRGPYVIRLSDPTPPRERLQLAAARLQGRTIAIMPQPCKTVDEWVERYRNRNPS
jgi:hypothetical protein